MRETFMVLDSMVIIMTVTLIYIDLKRSIATRRMKFFIRVFYLVNILAFFIAVFVLRALDGYEGPSLAFTTWSYIVYMIFLGMEIVISKFGERTIVVKFLPISKDDLKFVMEEKFQKPDDA